MVHWLWKVVWQFLRKAKHRIIIPPSNSTPSYIRLKRIESGDLNKC